jgi:hypothetical protein
MVFTMNQPPFILIYKESAYNIQEKIVNFFYVIKNW